MHNLHFNAHQDFLLVKPLALFEVVCANFAYTTFRSYFRFLVRVTSCVIFRTARLSSFVRIFAVKIFDRICGDIAVKKHRLPTHDNHLRPDIQDIRCGYGIAFHRALRELVGL